MSEKSISIIIPGYDHSNSLINIFLSCHQLHPLEIICVVNKNATLPRHITENKLVKIIEVDETLHCNNRQVIGAEEANGDVLLFLDPQSIISSSVFYIFLEPLLKDEADVVLNNVNKIFYKKERPNTISIWQQVVNHIFHRPDLNIDSFLSLPYGITRAVIETIGLDSLLNPILAEQKVIHHNFRIVHHVEVDSHSPFHTKFHDNEFSLDEKRMIHHYIEAIANHLHSSQCSRAKYTDGKRRRDLAADFISRQLKYPPKITVGKQTFSKLYGGKQLSIIIPVQNEEKTIKAVIQELKKLEPLEIIVVINGTTDRTEEIAKKCGATVISYEEALGNDTGRAIGAYFSKGDILLFVDGDFVIPKYDLLPFVQAVQNGVDLALNNLDSYYMYRFPYSIVTACKYAVNVACARKDLGMGSTIAVPHAFSRNCIEKIGYLSLVCPVYSQVKAILEGFCIKNVHSVSIDTMNRVRPEKHFSKNKGISLATQQIIGDHVEGISYLITQKGIKTSH
ncbi:glycosyltransferase [Bacillus cytotoxicus]|uniref:glycosyltransferase n=1 Tax=Bacillus cytotoxicus TaxID=580165 RepID=UPI003D7F0D3D